MEDGHDINAKLDQWRKPIQLAIAFLIFAVAYLLFYPALIIFLANKTEVFDDIPSWFEMFVDYTAIPLAWLYDNLQVYRDFLDWLDEVAFPS